MTYEYLRMYDAISFVQVSEVPINRLMMEIDALAAQQEEQIAVGAPNVMIYSTWLNNQFALLSGTSQATQIMAGIAALLLDWSRNTAGAREIHRYMNMLEILDEMCDHYGRIGVWGRSGTTGFGIPRLANISGWK